MSPAQHKSGPWAKDVAATGTVYVWAADGRLVCTLSELVGPQTEADAAVIVNAPDLLSDGRLLVAYLQVAGMGHLAPVKAFARTILLASNDQQACNNQPNNFDRQTSKETKP